MTATNAAHCQLLLLSAETREGLEQAVGELVESLRQSPRVPLSQIAGALQARCRPLPHRLALIGRDVEEAIQLLASRDPRRVKVGRPSITDRPLVFAFPGLGEQYPQMGRGLYQTEPLFRATADRCFDHLPAAMASELQQLLFPDELSSPPNANWDSNCDPSDDGLDMAQLLFPTEPAGPDAHRLNRTLLAHPALLVIEVALAQWLASWGLRPQKMIGHSLGELTAAYLAGVLTLPEAFKLVVGRAQLIDGLPLGSMLAVPLSEEELPPLLNESIALAAVNGPSLCVLAGSQEAIDSLAKQLAAQGIVSRRLRAVHACHSPLMEPVREPCARLVSGFELRPPTIPYVSNLTGNWITAEQATNPTCWGAHLVEPVRFASGLALVLKSPESVLLEVGPGRTCCNLSRSLSNETGTENRLIPTMRAHYDRRPDRLVLLNALAELWLAGVDLDNSQENPR